MEFGLFVSLLFFLLANQGREFEFFVWAWIFLEGVRQSVTWTLEESNLSLGAVEKVRRATRRMTVVQLSCSEMDLWFGTKVDEEVLPEVITEVWFERLDGALNFGGI